MTDSGCDTLLAAIVKSNHTAVRERQLQLTLALLTCNLTCYGAVNLVGQPILTCNSLQLQHVTQVLLYLIVTVCYILILTFNRLINHVGLGR